MSIGGADIDLGLLSCIADFLKQQTCVGICSVERGGMAFNLHFQMVACMWATLLIAVKRMVKACLGWDSCKLVGASVLCRALKQRGMHTFRGMVGYCLKDRDELHFQKVEHNISADDINDGIELHNLYGAYALKNKVCLTPANVFDRTLMFWRFKLNHPIGNGFLNTLRRMISSGTYYPSSHWIISYQGRGMPVSKIDALWKYAAFHSCFTDLQLLAQASSPTLNPSARTTQSPIFSVHAAPSSQPPSQTMLTQGSSSQNTNSLLSLLKSLDITAWLCLYATAREGPSAAIKRMQDLATNLQIITDGDARELKEWLEQSLALMKRFMELQGKKLCNDPIARQNHKALLSRFSKVSLSPSPTTDNSLLPDKMDEEELRVASQAITIASPSRNHSSQKTI
ncbi:hypothetical protein L7F22_043356 [Adiantum nelumboides]|nr:hypothetical protein [Adiantum nelumboides]